VNMYNASSSQRITCEQSWILGTEKYMCFVFKGVGNMSCRPHDILIIQAFVYLRSEIPSESRV
jgi:hypothetical protein